MSPSKSKLFSLFYKRSLTILSLILVLLFNFETTFSQNENKNKSYETVYQQDFSEDTTDWNLEPDNYDWGSIEYSFKDGMYCWSMDLQEGRSNIVIPSNIIPLPEEGYQISVETSFDPTCKGCDSGIMFNAQDPSNYYFVGLDVKGYVNIYANQNDKWYKIAENIKGRKFNPSGMNKITIINDGNSFEIQINDSRLTIFIDNRFKSGIFGLVAEGPEKTKTTVCFDNLELLKKTN